MRQPAWRTTRFSVHRTDAAGLGLLTCATALLAQFYPKPFPENYWLLVACVVVYFLLNTVLQVRRTSRQRVRGRSRC